MVKRAKAEPREDVAEEQPGGPRLPRLEGWLDVEPELLPGFRFRAYLGMSDETYRAIYGGARTRAERTDALRRVVLEHNRWRDEDGQPYQSADAEGFWDRLPTRLAHLVLSRLSLAVYETPLSMTRPRRS